MTDSALAIRLENFGTAFCETDWGGIVLFFRVHSPPVGR